IDGDAPVMADGQPGGLVALGLEKGVAARNVVDGLVVERSFEGPAVAAVLDEPAESILGIGLDMPAVSGLQGSDRFQPVGRLGQEMPLLQIENAPGPGAALIDSRRIGVARLLKGEITVIR